MAKIRDTKISTFDDLFDSLQTRKRPEDVAEMIREAHGAALKPSELRILSLAAQRSVKFTIWGFSSMLEDFHRPATCEPQVLRAQELFETAYAMSAAECADPKAVEGLIHVLGQEIQKNFGHSDFLHDRLNRVQRQAAGLDISKRRYNKLFRHLRRMEGKLRRMRREIQKLRWIQIGKSGLATEIRREDFMSCGDSAAFIAYLTARSNLRSEFTVKGQQRAYDQIADMLFQRCVRNPDTHWFAVAHVYPEAEVLRRLTDQEKGELLGRWSAILKSLGVWLQEIWQKSTFQRRTMVVKPGDDSSTWNQTASAWNKARSHWLALVCYMGLDSLLDQMCPGKVMRLMAADVARWHRAVGGGLDPDTEIWSRLPLPWEVLSGEARSTRQDVIALCGRYGVDAVAKGWVAARPKQIAEYRPTPELVHGVTVADPRLARTLRRYGWFSGKLVSAKEPLPVVEVERDVHGYALGARPITVGPKAS